MPSEARLTTETDYVAVCSRVGRCRITLKRAAILICTMVVGRTLGLRGPDALHRRPSDMHHGAPANCRHTDRAFVPPRRRGHLPLPDNHRRGLGAILYLLFTKKVA